MKNNKATIEKIIRRHKRVRGRISGTSLRPRLSIFRSSKHMFVQFIDDTKGKTLLALSDKKIKGKTKTDKAFNLGKEIASLARKKDITKAVFDRGGYKYHGRVKAVAEGARDGGLIF